MQTSDWIASFALVVSGGAFALELRRWFASGPKLILSVMADAMAIPNEGDDPFLVLTVTNRGDTPTTITHMIGLRYENWWQRWRNRPQNAGIVNTSIMPIPHSLGVNQSWMGRMNYNEPTNEWRSKDQLYIGVNASHSDKYFVIKVPKKKPNLPTEKIPG